MTAEPPDLANGSSKRTKKIVAPPKVSSNPYHPLKRNFDTYAGLDVSTTTAISKELARLRPFPAFQELGRLDIQALTRSIESNLPAEVGNALDILVVIAGDRRWGLPLLHCADLLEVLVDCLAESIETLRCDADAATTCFLGYSDLLAMVKLEAQHVTQSYTACSVVEATAAQRVMSIMTILRNLAFTDVNQDTIADANGLVAALAAGLTCFCSRRDMTGAVSTIDALEFTKDTATLLSLIGGHLKISDPSAFGLIFQLLLSFCPPDAMAVSSSSSEDPAGRAAQLHPYLITTIDALAKILARDVPNRQSCEAVFTQYGTSYTLQSLQKLMTLAVAVLPEDFSARQVHILTQRLPLLQHALMLAEVAADLCPHAIAPATKWLGELSLVPLRLTILYQILSRPAGLRNVISPPEIAIMKRRSVAILKTLLEKCGVSSGSSKSTGVARITKLVNDYEADIVL